MDLAATVRFVDGWFRAHHRPWALIGGLAMGLRGRGRATFDVDLAADVADQETFIADLEAAGFATLNRSSGYSNHERGGERVDVVWLRGATAARLLGDAEPLVGIEGLVVPVASAQHLAALKVHAIAQDPERVRTDLEDLLYLAALPGFDRGELRERLGAAGLKELVDAFPT